MIRKARRGESDFRLQEPELTLASGSKGPDPRLVELVRLLARRAARQWFEEMKGAPKSKRS